jgi:Glycosyltransferase family 87
VVGSRLLEHKKTESPYYYKWKKEDGDKYLDLYDSPFDKVNRNTVTPFVLQLLYPINDFQFTNISTGWFIAELAALIILVLLVLFYESDRYKRLWILLIALVFIGCSQAYTFHLISGQVYIFHGLLLMLIYLWYDKTSLASNVMTAALLALLVLIRPIAVVFLLPFIIQKKWVQTGCFIFFIGAYIMSQYFANGFDLWWGYFKAVNEGAESYFSQLVPPSYEELNYASAIEGSSIIKTSLYWHISEDSSLRGLFFRFLKIKLHSKELMIITGILAAFILFWFRKRIMKCGPQILFVLAFVIYMIAEFCLPAIRNSYNYVQWIFPLMIIFSAGKMTAKFYGSTILAGILAMGFLKFLPFDLTLAELIFAAICFYYINTKTTHA